MGNTKYKFNRLELAGSLGDLGTLLPLAIGMILINGLSPVGLFLSASSQLNRIKWLLFIWCHWYLKNFCEILKTLNA